MGDSTIWPLWFLLIATVVANRAPSVTDDISGTGC